MAQARNFSAIIKQGTYDILSADTDFYAFITQERLYNLFQQLLHKDDVKTFIECAEALDDRRIVLRLLAADGTAHPFYVSVEKDSQPGRLKVNLADIEKLVENEKILHVKMKVQGKLIELYGDDAFVYDYRSNRVTLITDYSTIPKEVIFTLEDLEERMRRHVTLEQQDEFTAFMNALRNGDRYFDICVNGDILETNPNVQFSLIKGATIYEQGERVVSVAYIHKAKERQSGEDRKFEVDSLTGLLGKAAITNAAIRAIDMEKRENISIAIVDMDYFKKINDTYGHQVGDEVIKKMASILEKEVGDHGIVGRIGGDEFMIMFYDVYDLENARELLRGIKNNVVTEFPPNNENKPVLSVSIGCAAYPKDADNYNDLFALADAVLYRAKEKGRNRYIIYDIEKHGSLEQIKSTDTMGERVNARGDMSHGDILCVLMDKVYSDKEYSLEKLLDDYNDNFEAQRITIYDADKAKVLYMVGEQVLSAEIIEETQKYILGAFWKDRYQDGEVVINNISHIEAKDIDTYNLMKKQGIISCIHIKFKDKNGADCVICFEAVSKNVVWNANHLHYYRLMARLLSNYVIVPQ